MREPKVKNLLKYLREYRLESFLGPLFKMLEATFELFIPLVVAKIIDVGIQNRDGLYIVKMGSVQDPFRRRRPGRLSDGPVFQRKGGGGIFHSVKERSVCPY